MDWISGWWMEQIVSKIWCDETICSCIVCTGAILHTRANIQLWSAQSFWPNLLLLHGSAFMCRSCRQRRESQRGSIRLGSSKAPLPLLHSHLFPITGKKKQSTHQSARQLWQNDILLLAALFPLLPWMHRAPPATLKMAGTSWRSLSLTPFLCSDLETKMKEWLCVNNCSHIIPLPPQKKKKKHWGEMALINTDSQGGWWKGEGRESSAYPHLSQWWDQNVSQLSLFFPNNFRLQSKTSKRKNSTHHTRPQNHL